MERKGILSLGDAFIDYVSQSSDNNCFERSLGGASVNVAVHISRFAIPSFYLTKLGSGEDSQFVEKEMLKEKINLKDSVRTPTKQISKVYVHLDASGEREFHKYENETPNEVVLESDLKESSFENKSIFYFGSGTLFHPSARVATKKAIEIAKMSKEELLFLLEIQSVEKGLANLEKFQIPFKLITLGEKGAIGQLYEEKVQIAGKVIKAIDTNGSGDAFMATILACIYEKGFPACKKEMESYIDQANRLGAIVARNVGSLPILPDYQMIMGRAESPLLNENEV
ncbi:hypothetical protein HRF69_21120 [Bacillus circulans]|uniref:PfkB family carbohydrate kinase n=1 Tax=Niallia circulans TaxID=1397 RepID=UPI0015614F8A|nr:PfkB family carbohydrate kinase [Niallia circulans]NRG29603.1 hypothetical protein [Niallia circulans]